MKDMKLEVFSELNSYKIHKKEDVGLKPPHYIQKNGYVTSSTII